MTAPLPKAWSEVPQLAGLDLIDKASLIGVPFLITGVEFTTNNNGVEFVYVDCEDINRQTFTFNDSSSGVRAQLVKFVTEQGQGSIIDSHEWTPLQLVVPRGLRVSEFEVTDARNRPKMAKTYYLTTSGQRASQVASDAPATGRRTAPATKATTPAGTKATANAEA